MVKFCGITIINRKRFGFMFDIWFFGRFHWRVRRAYIG